jgi:VCBS repeat-containing protein
MDIIVGTNASETINGTNSTDLILAINGSDTVNAGDGNDIVIGGNGSDTLNGDAGSDIIDGGSGNDILSGGSGADILSGGAGNDVLDGDSGSDILNGGAGDDTLVYNASENVGSFDVYSGGSQKDTLRLVVSQAIADSALFQADIAALRARLSSGSASYAFESFDLVVTSIEKLEVIVEDSNHAPVAAADLASVQEDGGSGPVTGNLLANDTDVDPSDTHVVSAITDGIDNGTTITVTGTYGTLVVTKTTGAYSYTLNNALTSVQALAEGEQVTEQFAYTNSDNHGAASTSTLTVTITGSSDSATITATTAGSDAGAVAEDDALHHTAGGQLSVNDVDSGQNHFASPASLSGSYGTFTFNTATGQWGYTLDDSKVQFLGAGETTTDKLTVTSADDTATHDVTVTISGTNDAAVIGTPTGDEVTEDTDALNGNLTASGTISIFDADQGQSSLQTSVTSAADNLGSLVLGSDGAYTYTVANSATQALGANDTRTDTFTVTALDGTTKQVTFAIHGTQDAPTLSVEAAASGLDNANIALNIQAGLIDTSNTLVVSIGGVPSSYTLNHGTISEDGSTWLVTPADLSTLALIPVGGLAKQGSFDLHIVASSSDGMHVATSSADIKVTVSPNPDAHSGFALDGYIAGATVFADANDNGILDDGEAHATTNADGSFTLNGGSGTLVMFGGVDISTNLSFEGVLTAPEGSTVVTPLTTLIMAIVNNSPIPISTADAASQIAAAFGLDPTKDLTTFDPVSAAVSGGDAATIAAATAILSAGIQVQSTVAQISAVGGSVDAVFSAIADAITTSASNPDPAVDLSTSSTVQNIVANSDVSTEAVAAVTAVVAAANESIQSATDLTELAQAAVVAQGEATAQLAATDFNDPLEVNALTDSYVDNLDAQVANAVVGVTGLALLGTLGNDVLTGGAGNDAIDGLDGNDQIGGGEGNDQLYGGAGNDNLTGGTGDDRIDGGAGYDRTSYADAVAGVTIDLTAGTASGTGIGNDTLVSIESVVGSDFADTFSAAGFGGSSGVVGFPIGLSTFEGKGGDDHIIGNVNPSGVILTQISYVSATGAVTVDFRDGTASGDASVGNDTFTNVNLVMGSAYDDILRGSDNPSGTFEQYDGRAGNDLIDGRGGYDFAVYNKDPVTLSGITVNLAAGTVTGDATVGTDTLLSVEAVRGTSFADTYNAAGFNGISINAGSFGTFNNFDGQGGNDTIIGNGNTRIQYTQSLDGVTVDIALGTAHGTAAGDVAQVGTDTFSGVNAVMGSMFDDTFLGSNGNETFQGLGGDDSIDGRGGFDVAQYNNLTYVTGAINVDMAAGIVTGDTSNGTDTLRSIEGVQGTFFDDTYVATGYGVSGALNVGNNQAFNQFEGMAGNDSIAGNGNTRIIYASATDGVTINLVAGTATGGASVGSDTFTGINSATGSNSADVYDATGFTGTPSFGTFNLFEGLGGNDTITGNGNTRIAYSQAAAGVTVDLSAGTAHGTAAGNGANVGTDTITGGVNSVQGSNFADVITGGSGNETFFGGGGSDAINGGGGNDTITGGVGNDIIDGGAGTDVAVFTGPRSAYTINVAAGTVTDNRPATASFTPEGTDTLSNVEVLQFSDGLALASSGSAGNPIDVSGLFFPNGPLTGTAGDDYLTIGFSMFNRAIDLGAGNNTVTIGVGGGNLNLTNVQHLVGSSNDDFITLSNSAAGLAVDLGAGTNDNLNLANGANTLSVTNVETLNGNDFSASSDDTLTLLNNVSGVSINLGNGTNTINLAAGANTLVNAFGTNIINGTESDDSLTVVNGLYQSTVDLGGGTDTLVLTNPMGYNELGLVGVETVTGGTADDYIVLQNTVTGVTFDLGIGNDTLNLASGPNSVSVTGVEIVNGSDFSGSSDDTLTLLNNVSGVTLNLGNGTNTLNLAAGSNTLGNIFNINAINGSASDDALTLQNQINGSTIDLGDGVDSLTLAGGFNDITVTNIENVVGGSSNDSIVIANTAGSTTVTGGLGSDTITASAASDNFRFTGVADSTINGTSDTVVNFDAGSDTFTFSGIGVANGSIQYVDIAAFAGGGQASAHLQNLGAGNDLLQIDINGDGAMTSADIEINLVNLSGSLQNSSFLLT